LKSSKLWHFVKKLEPVIIVFFLLCFWDFSIPPFLPLTRGAINAGSYLFLLLLILGHWKKFIYVITRDILLLLLIAITLSSIFWSAAPEYTSDETKAVLRATLFGVYLATRYSLREQRHIFTWLFSISALLSVPASLVLPAYGINSEGQWRGIFVHKQYLARMMTIGAGLFVLTAFYERKHRWIALSGAGLAVALILLSQSKSALILLLFSLSVVPLSKVIKQDYKLQVFFYIVVLLIASVVAILILSNIETIVVDTLGKDMDFNGRVPIWNLSIEAGLKRPWLGYGYAGFWTSDEALYILHNTWASVAAKEEARFHAHNGFIDLFLELGVVGVSIFILHLFGVFLRLFFLIPLIPTIESFWLLISTTLFVLYNLSEAKTFVGNHSLWIMYVSIAFSTALQQDRTRKKQGSKLLRNKYNNYVLE